MSAFHEVSNTAADGLLNIWAGGCFNIRSFHRKGSGKLAVGKGSHMVMVGRDIGEVIDAEGGKMATEPLGVSRTKAVSHDGTNIAKYGLLDIVGELIDVLMRQVQPDAILADF